LELGPLIHSDVLAHDPAFDIYKLESTGEAWIATESLEAAKEFVTKHSDSKPGEYVICSRKTEPQIWIRVPAAHARPLIASKHGRNP
jgi:ribosomal protein L16/L10AE